MVAAPFHSVTSCFPVTSDLRGDHSTFGAYVLNFSFFFFTDIEGKGWLLFVTRLDFDPQRS